MRVNATSLGDSSPPPLLNLVTFSRAPLFPPSYFLAKAAAGEEKDLV